MEQHNEEHKCVPRQHTQVPDLMVAKIWRKWIRLSVGEDQRADRVEKSARDEQGNGSHAKLGVDGADKEDDDPTHQQKTDVRHQYRYLCEEDGFESDEENRKAPDDPKKHPACGPAENGQAERGICACDQDVNGIMVEDAEDPQVFSEKQKEMQQAAK